MKTIFLSLLLVIFLSQERGTCQGQVATDNKTNFENGLGIAGGFTTGYGISYRFQPNKFGVQVTFFPYKDSYTTIYSTGLTFLYKLMETKDKKENFFIYESNAYFYNKTQNQGSEYYVGKEGPFYTYDISSFFNNGVGIGGEVFVNNWFDFDVMGGYCFRTSFTFWGPTIESCFLFKF